ncbi:hypothetical protein ACWEFD_18150 [Streptomyces ardesiacus]
MLLCDVLPDGTVVGQAAAEAVYDTSTGARVGTRIVDPATGAPYTPLGVVQPCPEAPPGTAQVYAACTDVPRAPIVSGRNLIDNGDFAQSEGVGATSTAGPGFTTEYKFPSPCDDIFTACGGGGSMAYFNTNAGQVAGGGSYPTANSIQAQSTKSLAVNVGQDTSQPILSWRVPLVNGHTYELGADVAIINPPYSVKLTIDGVDVMPLTAPDGPGVWQRRGDQFTWTGDTGLHTLSLASNTAEFLGNDHAFDNFSLREVTPGQDGALSECEYHSRVRACIEQVVQVAGCNDDRRDAILANIAAAAGAGGGANQIVVEPICVGGETWSRVTLYETGAGSVVGVTYFGPDGSQQEAPPAYTLGDCPQGNDCASPTTPTATVGLCLPDGTPIAVTVIRDCDGVITSEGWLNLTTGAYSAGAPPAGTVACGTSQSIQVSGTFCDIDDATGDVLGLVLVEYTYDESGAIASVRLVDAVTGTTYTPAGTITVCPAGVEQPERDLLHLCDTATDGALTPFIRDFARDENGAITGHSDYLLDGAPYTPAGTVGLCGSTEACRNSSTVLVCDVPADSTTVITPTITDGTGADAGLQRFPDLPGPYTSLWTGGSLVWPANPGPAPAQIHPVAVGKIAADLDGCDGASGTLNVSVRVTNNGPGRGQAWDGALQITKGTTVLASRDALHDAPAGWSGTLTLAVPVTAADVAAGDLCVALVLETFHLSSKQWTADQFTMSLELEGCEVTSSVQFLRTLVTDCETGDVVATTDTTLDGQPYEVTGTVGQCIPASSDPTECRDCEQTVLCDVAEEGTHTFLRTVCRDCTGAVVSVLDTELDGTTAYAAVGTVGACPPPCRSTHTEVLCDSTPQTLDLTTTFLPFAEVPIDGAGSVEIDAGLALGQQLWDGETVAIGPSTGAHDLTYAAGTLAADCPGCGQPDDEVTVTVAVTALFNGPTAGSGSTGGLELLNGTTTLGTSPYPQSTPVGWTGTPTVTRTVPLADLLAGRIRVRLGSETNQGGPRSWTFSDFTATAERISAGCGQRFLRTIRTDCVTGELIDVIDTTLDGQPYTVTGDVAACLPTDPCTGPECETTSVQVLRLCDLDPSVEADEDGRRCAVPFLRHLAYDCAGNLLGFHDTGLDGTTPYTPVQVVDCQCASGQGVTSSVEVPWTVVSVVEDPAGTPQQDFLYTVSPENDPSRVGTIRVHVSRPAGGACGAYDINNLVFSNTSAYTLTLDDVAQEMSYLRVDLIDFDTFEPVGINSGSPTPTRLGGTAGWNAAGTRIVPSESNGTGYMYWDNPPEVVSWTVFNQGGGTSCSALSFQGMTVEPGGCCGEDDGCSDCGPVDTGVRSVTGTEPQDLAGEFPGLQSVSLAVLAGTVNVTTTDGTDVPIPAGITLTWSVAKDTDTALAAASFTGADASTSYLLNWTRS